MFQLAGITLIYLAAAVLVLLGVYAAWVLIDRPEGKHQVPRSNKFKVIARPLFARDDADTLAWVVELHDLEEEDEEELESERDHIFNQVDVAWTSVDAFKAVS